MSFFEIDPIGCVMIAGGVFVAVIAQVKFNVTLKHEQRLVSLEREIDRIKYRLR